MSQSNYTTVQIDNGELIFYKELEQHINSLSKKFRIKSVIRQIAYNDIVKCLLLSKGAPLELFGAKWIPRFAVEIFLKQCVPCQIRKPLKQHVIGKPIISLGVMTRLQIDLIDMRTRPDILKPDIIYNWILSCIDHFSKFSWSYPLKNKSATEVVLKLRELFFVFGPPRLLHSDNG
ncbi:unnamed protein product [Rotaria magnacalcarata]|uniref:Integrase catalytic domain-containing protein n=1 Tax=Rotaria magnacalcarata TaxID=392030 RepID=A0A815IYW1_9BILA|nr:unnamed protein product [Rotaria magnacalcarata]